MTYLAHNNTYTSLRDLHKKLDNIQSISLKTVIDYVDFSIQEKILKRVYKYDLKNNKTITSKGKYYFSDN
jgi:predicted AAA+ superfamily ATPase